MPSELISATSFEPKSAAACSFGWIEMGGSELIIEVGRGGRWELPWEADSLDLLEQIVEAVTAGRVEERIRGRTARLTVTLADGKQLRTSVTDMTTSGPHFWRRQPTELRRYAAYQQ